MVDEFKFPADLKNNLISVFFYFYIRLFALQGPGRLEEECDVIFCVFRLGVE